MRNVLKLFFLSFAFFAWAQPPPLPAPTPGTSPVPVPQPTNPPAAGLAPNPLGLTTTPENEGYSFNPINLKRDPFVAPDMEQNGAKKLPDQERYDLNEMRLVAILTGLGAPQAMIALPNGKSVIVQENDKIGRREGKILKIKDNEVLVRELYKDFQNRTKESQTSLVIAE